MSLLISVELSTMIGASSEAGIPGLGETDCDIVEAKDGPFLEK